MPSGLLSFKNKQKNIHFLKKEKKKREKPRGVRGPELWHVPRSEDSEV